ncbi:uncharacterized protein ARMOST_22410 [Armillaria ostoyae]|uniref:Uncharacterized protein n=1 Tax=Armillaria ostoyae TaxID=47428 RepID=A0A284SCU2_ARMOS|nr:uncharacterized protein ARMOST_22410 [Armillaria ostoyae]
MRSSSSPSKKLPVPRNRFLTAIISHYCLLQQKTSSYCSEIIVTINMNLKKAIGSVWRRVVQASAKVAKKFKREGIYDAWNARTPQQVFQQQRGVAMYFDDD